MRALFRLPLWVQILGAIGVAVVSGWLIGPASPLGLAGSGFSGWVVSVYSFLGDLFLRALRMLIVPLIAAAVITAVAKLGREHAFGRLGLKTLGYYALTSLLSILVGLTVVNAIRPGIINGAPGGDILVPEADRAALAAEAMGQVGERSSGDVIDVFKRMIPENVVAAGSDNGAMLSIIFFSLLVGYTLSRLGGHPAVQTVARFFEGVYEVMIFITDLVMRTAPLGVLGLVGEVAATTEPQELLYLGWFFLTVVLALGIHFFIVLPVLLVVLGRVKPVRHYRAMGPALLTAFSTSSSSATLPLTIECTQKRAGVSERTSNFVLPLGATVNMDGTALYECVVVIFLAQLFGIPMDFAMQFLVVLLALLTSVGVAGVPSASLVAILVILNAAGFPPEFIGVGLGLVMITDRILDMLRTVVNVFSDTCGAVIIARSEGETAVLADDAMDELSGPLEDDTK